MIVRPLRLVLPLISLLAMVLLLAGCDNPEQQEALGTPDPQVTLGVLPETGGELTSAPEQGQPTTVVTDSAEITSGLPMVGGDVTGTETGPAPLAGTSEPGQDYNQVQVVLQEYSIEMVDTIPAGLVLFEITNDGIWEHGFVLTGNGITATLERPLAPDELGAVQVELTPGTYKVYCPVEGHAGLGMKLELTVTEP